MKNRKDLFLLFHGRFPSEKAAALFAAKEAESFADIGLRVIVIVPRRLNTTTQDSFSYFGVRRNFVLVRIPILDLFWLPLMQQVAFYISLVMFSIGAFFYLCTHALHTSIIYSNESLPLWLASFAFPKTAYEQHDFPEHRNFFYASLFARVRWIITTNDWKASQLLERFHIPREKIVVERNAVDLKAFVIPETREEARKRLSVPIDCRMVLYTGHLYAWKGVDVLAQAARACPDLEVYLIGGTFEDEKLFRRAWGSVPNLHIIGYQPHGQIPLWQRAADVLVLPNSGREEISVHYTSPMKLFEYMASGTPIVASNLPSIVEIVGNDRAILVEPDNPSSLCQGIRHAYTEEGVRYAARARKWIRSHDWNSRARRIIAVLEEQDVEA